MSAPVVMAPEFLGVIRSLLNSAKKGEYRLSADSKDLFYDLLAKVRHKARPYPDRLEDETKYLCDCTIALPDDTGRAWRAFEDFQEALGRRDANR